MRKAFDPNLRLDKPAIMDIKLNFGCRDEIIPILAALQHVYSIPKLRDSILQLVAENVNGKSNSKFGRPGMDYWSILVLAAVRLGCNLDYDKLQNLAENHRNLRYLMGFGDWDADIKLDWRRIRDNLCLISPDTIKQISNLIVAEGHKLVPDAAKTIRGDSFVVKSNIHYPTESSLIGDGLRKILTISSELAFQISAGGWRQHKHLQKKIKRILWKINMVAARKGRNFEERLKTVYTPLFEQADLIMERALELHAQAGLYLDKSIMALEAEGLYSDLTYFLTGTEQVLGYAKRRILNGEKIANSEKLFSLFEPYTELINRGKRPIAIEFGRMVFLVEDGAGFICHHRRLDTGELEKDMVVPEVKYLQDRFDWRIERASFDRAFHSPKNQEELAKIVAHPCVPKKGRHKAAAQNAEATVEFRQSRRSHPGIESAIGALQSGNGLERCRDRTEAGFDRYVALGILGRNLHVLGKILIGLAAPKSAAASTKRKDMAA